MSEEIEYSSYNRIKRLSDSELETLWHDYLADKSNKKLRDTLIVQYIYLTRYVIGRIKNNLPQTFSLEDVTSFGVEGLIDAIEKYTPDRGARLETYALMRIRGAIIDKIRSQDWVPRSTRKKIKEIKLVAEQLKQSLGRAATTTELAAAMIMEKEKIINGELHIYCESDGEYYPKHKTENGVQMELDEKYFVYVLSGDSIDKSIARNKVDPYLDEFYSENFEEQEYHFYKRAREKFLKEEKPILYRDLKDEQFLNTHLNDVEAQATKLEKKLIEQYSVRENLTENLKRENMLLWIQRYNSIKIRAKEVVLETYIYV